MKYYHEHFKNRNINEYTIDGTINSQCWEQSSPKILFVLKENYGYQGCGIVNTKDLAHGWLDAHIKTYKKIILLSSFIFASHNLNRVLNSEETNSISNDFDLLHSTLDKISVINIKKHSGASRSKDNQIRKESGLNKDILKLQINNLKPDIIIAGSTVCWNSLIFDLNIFPSNISCEKNCAIKHKQTILCHTNHPSAWTGGGFDPYLLHQKIYELI